LSDKPRFEEIAQELVDYVAGAEIIIHNAPFDLSFLDMELKRTGKKPFKSFVGSVLDTLVMAKEMFPGKRNSLDALCDRLEVDNSGRTLHGALLDAELLADVYINMTRGQDALLMESSDTQEPGLVVEQLDLRSMQLPVLEANAQEMAAHDDVLAQLDKSSGGKTVWKQMA
jgi:DNA polymerase-3 subunit epsilon